MCVDNDIYLRKANTIAEKNTVTDGVEVKI